MAYIALKPCRFAGRDFRIGETVPGELVHPGAAVNLVKMKILGKADGEVDNNVVVMPAPALSIRLNTENGDLYLEPTEAGIQDVFSVLTSKAAEAEEIVKQMTDADALILLHMADGRKTIKAAAEDRASVLDSKESAGEQ